LKSYIQRDIYRILQHQITTTPELVSALYKKLQDNISEFRKIVDRPLTLSEKILIGHLVGLDIKNEPQPEPGKSYVFLQPDRVALQDVTGQMAILQFMQAGLKRTALPTTLHCDHLIQARVEGESDTKSPIYDNIEVNNFLESASRK
jgi:aconitate hydratase